MSFFYHKAPNKLDRVRGWLDSKVDDHTIESKYKYSEYSLNRNHSKYVHVEDYQLYYGDNDIDLENGENEFLSLVQLYHENRYDPYDSEDEEFVDFLDYVTERYRPQSFFKKLEKEKAKTNDNYGWSTVGDKTNSKPEKSTDTRSIDILIPPNTNRYHTNYLFKELVNYVYDNNMFYEIDKGANDVLVDPSMKKAFYTFCYNFTHKRRKW